MFEQSMIRNTIFDKEYLMDGQGDEDGTADHQSCDDWCFTPSVCVSTYGVKGQLRFTLAFGSAASIN